MIGDIPPPISGPEILFQKLINSRIRDYFQLRVFGFRLNQDNATRGDLHPRKILQFFLNLREFRDLLQHFPAEYVSYSFSQTLPGFMKDFAVILMIKPWCRKLILHMQGSNFNLFYARQAWPVRFIIRHTLNSAAVVFVQSECISENLAGIVKPDKIHVLYNTLDKNELTPLTRAKPQMGMNVLFLANLSFSKGYHDTLRAIPYVIKEVPDVIFSFAGAHVKLSDERNIKPKDICAGVERLVADAHTIEQRYANHIRYLGVVTGYDKEAAWRQCDVFVLPSYSESFPTSVLEAMGHGLPVVTTPVGANCDIFAATPEILVEPGNPIQLAHAIVTLLRSKTLREKYGDLNYNLVQHKFTIDHVADQFRKAVLYNHGSGEFDEHPAI